LSSSGFSSSFTPRQALRAFRKLLWLSSSLNSPAARVSVVVEIGSAFYTGFSSTLTSTSSLASSFALSESFVLSEKVTPADFFKADFKGTASLSGYLL
jgi:hypothetical protein